MRKIRDVIRLNYSAGISIRQIHSSTKISVGSVQKLLKKAQELKLSWPLPESLNDSELARLFYPQADTRSSSQFHIPEWG